jgi:hypothetical protein
LRRPLRLAVGKILDWREEARHLLCIAHFATLCLSLSPTSLQGQQYRSHRVQSFFERFGWENLGGSSYRYPRLGSRRRTEDWFNHVIPALMLFRAFSVCPRIRLKKFTLDVQAFTGYNSVRRYGRPPVNTSSKRFKLYSSNSAFGTKKLQQWVNGVTYPD